MQNKEMIPAREFCIHHNIEISFINELSEFGLIEINTIEGDSFLASDQLVDLEKIIRFHYDLNINLEGIQTINHLLQRMSSMHEEIRMLNNKLKVYED